MSIELPQRPPQSIEVVPHSRSGSLGLLDPNNIIGTKADASSTDWQVTEEGTLVPCKNDVCKDLFMPPAWPEVCGTGRQNEPRKEKIRRESLAAAICLHACTRIAICRDMALSDYKGHRYGVWGGLRESERKQINIEQKNGSRP